MKKNVYKKSMLIGLALLYSLGTHATNVKKDTSITSTEKARAISWIEYNQEKVTFLRTLSTNPGEHFCIFEKDREYKLFNNLPEFVKNYIQNKFVGHLAVGSKACKETNWGGASLHDFNTSKTETATEKEETYGHLLDILLNDKSPDSYWDKH